MQKSDTLKDDATRELIKDSDELFLRSREQTAESIVQSELLNDLNKQGDELIELSKNPVEEINETNSAAYVKSIPQTVLLVEDYEDSRIMLKLILEDWGYRVIEAENGHNAIECVKQALPDLILMDIGLPDIDGITATRKIKEIANTEGIPIICVTANGKDHEYKALEAGCNVVVPKPIDFEIFRKVLSRYSKDDY